MKRETQKAIEVCAHWQGMVAPMVMVVTLASAIEHSTGVGLAFCRLTMRGKPNIFFALNFFVS